MRRILLLAAILIGVTMLVFWAASGNGFALESSQEQASFTQQIIMLVFLLSAIVLGWRGSAGDALKSAVAWIAIFAMALVGYAYRSELGVVWQRVAGEVKPSMPVTRGSAEIVLRRAGNGHFYADVDVNGNTIRMLADTGASTIALSAEDAEAAGIDIDRLDWVLRISTANGEAKAAEVTLDEVRVGSIVRRDVRAMVTRGMSGSLLGMSFFSTLSGMQIENDELVLRD